MGSEPPISWRSASLVLLGFQHASVRTCSQCNFRKFGFVAQAAFSKGYRFAFSTPLASRLPVYGRYGRPRNPVHRCCSRSNSFKIRASPVFLVSDAPQFPPLPIYLTGSLSIPCTIVDRLWNASRAESSCKSESIRQQSMYVACTRFVPSCEYHLLLLSSG